MSNYNDDEYDDYEEDYPFDEEEDYWDVDEESYINREFQDPGGRSALRAATRDNPRIYACPNCQKPNRLTRKDVELRYQCDQCADADEGYGY